MHSHNLDGAGLLKHHEEEPLVLWAFQPGYRIDDSVHTLPSLTHEHMNINTEEARDRTEDVTC